MADTRRTQIIEIVKKELIGPDLIDLPGKIQDNGEEILTSGSPLNRYIAGILFPQKTVEDIVVDEETLDQKENDTENLPVDDDKGGKDQLGNSKANSIEFMDEAEEIINLSNDYKQAAMSITAALPRESKLFVEVSTGIYIPQKVNNEVKHRTDMHYFRKQLFWNNAGCEIKLPLDNKSISAIKIIIDGKEYNLKFLVTYRYKVGNTILYTFSLENTHENSGETEFKSEDCFFQTGFKIKTDKEFIPLPDGEKISKDEDYVINKFLYRKIKSYAIGHGCAAEWDNENAKVDEISTSFLPKYEVKPIVPSSIDGVVLDMLAMSKLENMRDTITQLSMMCERYKEWILNLQKEAETLKVESDKITAEKLISNCQNCLGRMIAGIDLLKNNKQVQTAFAYMNRAMLMQQLHYNLPFQKWIDDGNNGMKLENPVELPKIDNPDTWYEKDKKVYGKWRPFQIAFILINLKSMQDQYCSERNIIDLIWFPTGGGKTEAYLGLSAYTIFIRRLKNKHDNGTTILMRYTLRLLTTQQYERAAAMICACDLIRKEHADLFGEKRISIGLWVGSTSTPNRMNGTQDNTAVKAYNNLYNGSSNKNPFVMLKCPWCGAQMGLVTLKDSRRELPGYKKIINGKSNKIIFQCNNSNHHCDFSNDGYDLPVHIVDDDIYETTPTLLIGTVDKFAMLPYLPEAQSLFGFENGVKKIAPDLIIQDELHLISGPLGSMVGHYETMIHELCTIHQSDRDISPKIIASTATISHAKEQCHALYACKENDVQLFPPSGLEAGDSFFAAEDKTRNGREYVGVMAAASSSIATTSIRLYASLYYAGKAVKVENESLRDPYWTNVGYYNSIRELGQAETWVHADISEYLDVIYKRRYFDKYAEDYKKSRRYIEQELELTSRISSDKIPSILHKLETSYLQSGDEKKVADLCLATNMISVGVDVPRLGLMTVAGQPKTTAEYIQATSRVGRREDIAPGLIFVLYNPGKPRDRSHFEYFTTYHSRLYCNVEPTSVTPFAPPLRDRALHAIIIGILRLENNREFNDNRSASQPPGNDEIERIKNIIKSRMLIVDPDEIEDTMKTIDNIFKKWKLWVPQKYHDFVNGDEVPLMFPYGMRPNTSWGKKGFSTPTSMRSVDASCEVQLLSGYSVGD